MVGFVGCTFTGAVTADLGTGNDWLNSWNNTFAAGGTLDGGADRDTVYAFGNKGTALTVKNIEKFI